MACGRGKPFDSRASIGQHRQGAQHRVTSQKVILVPLSDEQVQAFLADGFIRISGAFSTTTGRQCQDELWAATGYDRFDPSTWSNGMVRLNGFGSAAFREAASTPILHEAFDQLVGPGRWLPRDGLGTFPLRFPVDGFPGDGEPKEAGWHVEAGTMRVSLRSRGRALLMLFLFSEVGPDDAPTRVRVGSHLDVPPLLEPFGEAGRDWMSLCEQAVAGSAHRPVELVTGSLGDVYLCHPFLVHSAQAHRGRVPRFMAQPPLIPTGLLDLEADDPSPVARAVIDGLGRRIPAG
jgi:hypothetical protein